MDQFKFQLMAIATINLSDETGEVIGRAQYATGENQYLLRYKTAEGRATECWWSESALS